MAAGREILHATAIALGDKAALITGPSGSGKSDLALRCLALSPNKFWSNDILLISDDQVIIDRSGDRLLATPPATIQGKIEVRGIGIVPVPFKEQAYVCLIANLTEPDQVERMPDPDEATDILGVSVPVLRLAAFETSAAVKLLTRLSQCAP